jgi:hypothetical protein
MRQGHFFDLDTLINIDSKIWIVDKTKPSIPVVKISKSDFNLIKKGIFRKYDQKLTIGGSSYWIPVDLMNTIKIRCKNLKCDLTGLAFSMQEFMNPSVIENMDFDINTRNFEHLKNTRDDIYVICSKNSERNYQSIIEKLKDKLADYGLVIKNFYYLSETFYNRDKDDITHKKVRMLLQHLIGLKTDGDKFIDEEIEEYDRVYFYDDEMNAISLAKDSSKVFEFIVSNTEENLKLRIKDLIKDSDKVIVVRQITNNKVNTFIETEVLIEWSNLKKTFESFNYKRI